MKIGIDISQVIYETGVSWYTRHLVENLLKIDQENEYLLFGGSLRRLSDLERFTKSLKGNFKKKFYPFPPTLADFVWNRLHVLAIERLIGKIDVFHSSDWSQPPSKAFKVTTIHDLAPLKFPELSHPQVAATHKRRLELVRRKADRIIVPSEATKRDLAAIGFKRDRISVIPEAPSLVFKKQKKSLINKLKKKYRIYTDYLLAVGVGSRKNTERIIEAFEKVHTRDLKLIIIGRKTSDFDQKRGVRFTGHVPYEELPVFYSGAKALLYPSLYEGFGLPILEAMACGTPVVTSNISSMPEVAGRAAVLVDPYKVDSIFEGIEEALKSKEGLVKRGAVHVKQFSWEKTARETLKVYNEGASST